jgi:intracellular sulfur oxidation DsrE/DsrF family protein
MSNLRERDHGQANLRSHYRGRPLGRRTHHEAHPRRGTFHGSARGRRSRELRAAGVAVVVCGQAVAEHHFPYEWIASNVTLALSALTTITVLENEGYALMPV